MALGFDKMTPGPIQPRTSAEMTNTIDRTVDFTIKEGGKDAEFGPINAHIFGELSVLSCSSL